VRRVVVILAINILIQGLILSILLRLIFFFFVFMCGILSCLHVSFLLHVKYTAWYRIVVNKV